VAVWKRAGDERGWVSLVKKKKKTQKTQKNKNQKKKKKKKQKKKNIKQGSTTPNPPERAQHPN